MDPSCEHLPTRSYLDDGESKQPDFLSRPMGDPYQHSRLLVVLFWLDSHPGKPLQIIRGTTGSQHHTYEG